MKSFVVAFSILLFSATQSNAFEIVASILHLHPEANHVTDFRVDNDGAGEIIKYWNPALGAQPSIATLQAAWPAAELAKAKALKKEEVKAEGLSRIQVAIPAIIDFDNLQLVKEMILSVAPASRQLTTNIQNASDIYQAGSDAVVVLNGYTSIGQVESYNEVNDPSWP